MNIKNHTWSGTAVLANTCRNCSVNPPMEIKKENAQFVVFTLTLEVPHMSHEELCGVRTDSARPKQFFTELF